MELKFAYLSDTKTCYRFQTGERPEQMTMYLKKALVDKADINPKAGIIANIRQAGKE